MNYSKVIPYGEIVDERGIEFLLKDINKEFLNQLNEFNHNVGSSIEFRKKYNLEYFGELIERYQERGIAEDMKDFRTLVFFVTNTILTEKPNYNTNQINLFVDSVIKRLDKEFDLLTASFLVASRLRELKKMDSLELINKIIKYIYKNTDLMYEIQLYSIYTCWLSTKNQDEEDEINSEIISKCSDILRTIEFKKLEKLDNYIVYFYLIEMLNKMSIAKNSKLFKDKTICNSYKKMISLARKEYKNDNNLENAKKALNMDSSELYLYNYILSENAHYIDLETNVNSKGRIRLVANMLSYLEKEQECPVIVMELAESMLDEISEEEKNYGYGYYERGPEEARKILFSEYSYGVSRVNFKNLLELSNIDKEENKLILSEKFYMLLKEENKDLFDELSARNKLNLIDYYLVHNQKNISNQARVFKLLKEYDLNVEKLSTKAIEILFDGKFIDESSDEVILNSVLFENSLSYWRKKYSLENYIDKVTDVYENINNIDKRNNEYIGKSISYQKIVDSIWYSIKNVDIESISDKEIAFKFYKLMDELSLLRLTSDEYYKRLINNLKSEHYITSVKITEDEKLKILKKAYYNIEKYIENNPNAYYWSDIDRNLRFIYRQLKNDAFTEEEKVEILKQEDLKIEKSLIAKVESARKIETLEEVIEKTKEKQEHILNKAKEKLIKNNDEDELYISRYEISDVFNLIKKMELKGSNFDNEDLGIIARRCLKAI